MVRRLEIADDDALRFQQLQQVARWLIIVSIVGLVALGILYAFYESVGLAVIAAQTAVYAVALAWAARFLNQSMTGILVAALIGGMWAIILSMGLFFPESIPNALILLIVSDAIVFPNTASWTQLYVSVGSLILAAVLGTASFIDPLVPHEEIPEQASAIVSGVFIVIDFGLVLLLFRHYWARLSKSIADLRAAYRSLQRNQEELQDSEQRYRSLFDLSPSAIFVHDSREIVYVNQTAYGMLNASGPDDLIGKWDIGWFDPEDRTATDKLTREVFAKAATQPWMEIGLKTFDGDERIVQVASTDVPYLGQTLAQVVVRDVTEEKVAGEQRVEAARAEARAEELTQSRMRVIEASEALRKEIAQYLHSSVQAKLIVVKTRLDIMLNKARDGGLPDNAIDELGDISGTLSSVIEEDIRPVSLRLFPAILRRGLVPALWSLSDRFEAVLSLEYYLDKALENAERSNSNYLSEQIKVTLYRIVENALTNVVKHAEAETVKVHLQWDPNGELRLSIEDDGTGFDIGSASMGTGLGTMQDYAQSVDGSCEIHSVPGEGTTITATIPVPAYAVV